MKMSDMIAFHKLASTPLFIIEGTAFYPVVKNMHRPLTYSFRLYPQQDTDDLTAHFDIRDMPVHVPEPKFAFDNAEAIRGWQIASITANMKHLRARPGIAAMMDNA